MSANDFAVWVFFIAVVVVIAFTMMAGVRDRASRCAQCTHTKFVHYSDYDEENTLGHAFCLACELDQKGTGRHTFSAYRRAL